MLDDTDAVAYVSDPSLLEPTAEDLRAIKHLGIPGNVHIANVPF